MSPRNTSLKAIRARRDRLDRDSVLSDAGTFALAAAQVALDVPTLLQRLGADKDPDPELGYTPPMVVTTGDEEIFAHCGDCGAPLGSIRPDGRLDTFFLNWERHTMTEKCGG